MPFNNPVMLLILRLHDSCTRPSARQRAFLDLLKKAADNEPVGLEDARTAWNKNSVTVNFVEEKSCSSEPAARAESLQ